MPKKHKITRQMIRRLRKAYVIPSGRISNDVRDLNIIVLWEDGISMAFIAKIFNLSKSQVYRITRKWDYLRYGK